MASDWKYKIFGYLLGLCYELLSATWKYSVLYHETLLSPKLTGKFPDRSFVIAHWHGDLIALIGFAKHSKYLTVASNSKDGTIIAAAIKLLGFKVIRGSSSRGGTRALVSVIRALRKDRYFVALAIDGPRGPRHRAKPGAYYVAYKTGAPIVQFQTACPRAWHLPGTWDKSYVPKPFARITINVKPVPKAAKENQTAILQVLNSRGDGCNA